MDLRKIVDEGFRQQSEQLHLALQLCSHENRANLGVLLGHEGVMDSRFDPSEQWVRQVGLLTFRLKKAGKLRQFGEPRWFHRLYVQCPCCGKNVPVGRLHQHARTHVAGRVAPSEVALPKHHRVSIWHERWWVDERGYFLRRGVFQQRGFPLSAGF